jgi:hypothetical protein
MGSLFDNGKGKGASNAQDKAVKELKNLVTPDVSQMQVDLERLVQQGQITPEMAQAALVQNSEMSGISSDPALKAAQLEALQGLQDITNGGGLTAADRSQLNRIASEEQSKERGSREAILQNAQQRGVGGSGLELLAQLQNQQSSADRQSQRGLDVAATAQERALQALQQSGNLSGQMRSQDFNEQAQVAQAKDAINQFNAQNRQQVNLSNVTSRNNAQALNLSEKQRISDANATTSNTQQQYNKQLAQQDFENKYKKAGGTAGAYQNQAALLTQQGQASQQMVGGLIGAGAMLFSDERLKEDIKPFDASEFLDSLTGYKYTYKKPSMGEGKQVGVMAQDLEKTVPQIVKDTPEGKMVDYSPKSIGGPILAALGELNNRVKKIEGK